MKQRSPAVLPTLKKPVVISLQPMVHEPGAEMAPRFWQMYVVAPDVIRMPVVEVESEKTTTPCCMHAPRNTKMMDPRGCESMPCRHK